jgi:hypothetical protein
MNALGDAQIESGFNLNTLFACRILLHTTDTLYPLLNF